MTYYKAVRPDGTDFWNGTVQWAPKTRKVGRARIVKHPTSLRIGSHASQYLSVSTSPTDCTGMGWPCRLLTVEPVEGYEVTTPEPADLPNKRASVTWRVTGELDPHLALGPQGEQVAALIERARRLTADETRLLFAAWVSGWYAGWYAAWVATRDAKRDAAWDAAGHAELGSAQNTAAALVVRDLISNEHYDVLTLPWRTTIGRIHPDDPEVRP